MPLYFAYGSNLDKAQILERCPSAKFNCVARLDNYKIAFTRKSIKRRCGVADAVEATGESIFGVVYDISDEDMRKLDDNEGYKGEGNSKNSYNRKKSIVTAIVINGENQIQAEIYFAVRQPAPPLPSKEYLGLIITGAKVWGLPYEYIRKLEKIEVMG